MDVKKRSQLNKLENLLYFVVVAALTSDILLDKSNEYLLIVSTAILGASIVGIIVIEWVKLQIKQRDKA